MKLIHKHSLRTYTVVDFSLYYDLKSDDGYRRLITEDQLKDHFMTSDEKVKPKLTIMSELLSETGKEIIMEGKQYRLKEIAEWAGITTRKARQLLRKQETIQRPEDGQWIWNDLTSAEAVRDYLIYANKNIDLEEAAQLAAKAKKNQ